MFYYTNENYTLTGEILQDYNKKTGKSINWTNPKISSLELSKIYRRLGGIFEKKADTVEQCADYLLFGQCPKDGEKTLKKANFCKNKLCPSCNQRRSIALFKQTKELLEVANERYKLRYLFLTLTVKNCKIEIDDFENTLNQLFRGIDLFFRKSRIANNKNIMGWIRCLEVTETGNGLHPHIHILLAVKPNYFGSKKNYISHKEYTELWQNSLQIEKIIDGKKIYEPIDYVPIVSVKAVKSSNKKKIDTETGELDEYGGAILEVTKYSTKSQDYLRKSNILEKDNLVRVLDIGLKGRRLIGYGGIFYKIRKELKHKDMDKEDVDLTHIGEDESSKNKCSKCNTELEDVLYRWHMGFKNYIS